MLLEEKFEIHELLEEKYVIQKMVKEKYYEEDPRIIS